MTQTTLARLDLKTHQAAQASLPLAIELLSAAQAIDLRQEGANRLGLGTAIAHLKIREEVEFLENDRALAPDIEALAQLIGSGTVIEAVEQAIGGRP